MANAMDKENEQKLNGIGYEVAVPKERGEIMGHNPEHGDDQQRNNKRDEQRHLMIVVEFINHHDRVDVAPQGQTNGESTQSRDGFGDSRFAFSTESTGDGLRKYPYDNADNEHTDGNEPE